jgi:hypothetical protein
MLNKILKDVARTLYDDNDFKLISLPRVVFAISCICVIISWIADQFFEFKYSNMTQLVAWSSANAGAYAVKKYVDGGK